MRWVVGTGGALTRVPGGYDILRSICLGPGRHLLPPPRARVPHPDPPARPPPILG